MALANPDTALETTKSPIASRLSILDTERCHINDYCGGAWDDADPQWWGTVPPKAPLPVLMVQLLHKVPRGRCIERIYSTYKPLHPVVESTPEGLRGCPVKGDEIELTPVSIQAFWQLVRGQEQLRFVAVLGKAGSKPSEDSVKLHDTAKGLYNAFWEREEENDDDDDEYEADPDFEGKVFGNGQYKERPSVRSFPQRRDRMDKLVDRIQRRIIRQERLLRVVVETAKKRFDGYTPPETDPETVLFYLTRWKAWQGEDASGRVNGTMVGPRQQNRRGTPSTGPRCSSRSRSLSAGPPNRSIQHTTPIDTVQKGPAEGDGSPEKDVTLPITSGRDGNSGVED
jgi:hypothetical protein